MRRFGQLFEARKATMLCQLGADPVVHCLKVVLGGEPAVPCTRKPL